jgi:hypothetical protein
MGREIYKNRFRGRKKEELERERERERERFVRRSRGEIMITKIKENRKMNKCFVYI